MTILVSDGKVLRASRSSLQRFGWFEPCASIFEMSFQTSPKGSSIKDPHDSLDACQLDFTLNAGISEKSSKTSYLKYHWFLSLRVKSAKSFSSCSLSKSIDTGQKSKSFENIDSFVSVSFLLLKSKTLLPTRLPVSLSLSPGIWSSSLLCSNPCVLTVLARRSLALHYNCILIFDQVKFHTAEESGLRYYHSYQWVY